MFFSLLALVVWRLVEGLCGLAAAVSRAALLVFLVAARSPSRLPLPDASPAPD